MQGFIQDARADAGFILNILRHLISRMTDSTEIESVSIVRWCIRFGGECMCGVTTPFGARSPVVPVDPRLHEGRRGNPGYSSSRANNPMDPQRVAGVAGGQAPVHHLSDQAH